jgi:endo-1,4-beta-xylanase
MLRSAEFPRPTVCRLAFLGFAIAALSLAMRLQAQTVATYDFENSTDGWVSFNGASTPVSTNAASYTGSYSLLTTTGSSGQGGPSIQLNTVLQAGATYTITGYVLLTPGESAGNANFTMKRTDPTCSGGTCYDTIGAYQVPVNSSSWAQIGGTYVVTATETGLTLYAQLVGATSAQSFYLDDVVITETAPPPGGTPVASYNFSGGTDGWEPFGPVQLASVVSPSADPAGNTQSLLTTGRTATYMGPSLNLLSVNNIVAGATYQVTAYVMLATPDSSGPTATLSTKTTNCANSSGVYGNFGTSGPLSTTAWTQVQGTFSFSDLPGPPASLTLYVQSSSATDSFYLSGVTINELSAAPLPASEQDNSGITSTFEDGGLDGWSSRSGSSTLTNVSSASLPGTPPNGDTNSLYITGRVGNWDGPQISVSDRMYAGSVYDVSVWVMMPTIDSSSHVINISLQTTLDGNVSYPSVSSYPGVTVPDDGAWHQISVMNYTMSSAYSPGDAYLYLQTVPASGNDLTPFYMTDFQLTYVPPPTIQTDIPSIYKTLEEFFPVGAAVDTTDLSGPHAQLLTMHFNSMTPENDLKWSSVEPSLGTYDYTNGDAEVGEAVCHGMKVRGQNLVWATGAQTPSYAFGDGTNSAANQATVTANIQEHIMSEVQHYGSEVYAWDVVNEPIDPTQSDCLYHGPFYQVLGPQYINIAFDAAKQYAPAGTKLFLNDYSLNDPDRLACLVKVVHELLAEGVPISGIGHEMHNDINYPSIQMMANSIETIHRDFPQLEQQITELDESVYNAGDTTSNYGSNIPASVLAEQGWLYRDYFDLFRRLHRDLTAVTMWGMADDDTWLDATRTDYPLPFSTTLQAKPAYWGIVDPTQLPGYGLTFSLSGADTPSQSQTWTITARNGNVGPAYSTQITSLTLRQIAGRPCQPTITAPGSYPISLGDIATSGTATTTFRADFSSCSSNARFVLEMPWTSATYDTGTFFQFVDVRSPWTH